MPRLSNETAAKVEDAEDGFKPLDPGIYVVQLMEDVEIKEGKKGIYWKWTLEIPEGLENAGRRLWTNTSLSEAAFFKLKEMFSAFGVPTSTDTEELVGKKIRVQVKQVTINGGARAGELGNEIEKCLPLEGPVGVDEAAAVTAAVKAEPAKPLF